MIDDRPRCPIHRCPIGECEEVAAHAIDLDPSEHADRALLSAHESSPRDRHLLEVVLAGLRLLRPRLQEADALLRGCQAAPASATAYQVERASQVVEGTLSTVESLIALLLTRGGVP
jgi:hypothetical protein